MHYRDSLICPKQINLASHLICPQECAHVHDDPERRALAQPRHDVAVHAGSAGTCIALGSILVCPQQRAHVHDDPERGALAQPRHDVAAGAGGAGTSRLAHHTGATTNRTCGTR